MKMRIIRWIEFLVLFFGIPLLIYMDEDFLHPSILVLPVLVFVFFMLRRHRDFQWKEIFRWEVSGRGLATHGAIFLLMLAVAFSYVYFFVPEKLFNLPRSNPWIFVAMCFFYPVFSAFGQEIIYRTFLFRRYESIIPGSLPFILASGVTFSFLHIVYYDPVSMILTLVGGLYLAYVYMQTKSVLYTSVLHGLYGILVFGVGLGEYFWLDMPG